MQAFLHALAQTREAYAAGHITGYVENGYILNGLLFGTVYGDREARFWNGKKIHSSNILFSFVWAGYHLVTTRTNSTYWVASWQAFDPVGKGFDSVWSTHPIFHLGDEVNPNYVEHFDAEDIDEDLDKWRKHYLKIPRAERERRIPQALSDSEDEKPLHQENIHPKIFRLASLHLRAEQLESALTRAHDSFVTAYKTEMMIEYSMQQPDPDLMTLISIGYLPGWQSILVIDGTFRLSMRAREVLAEHLLAVLDPEVLPDFLLDLRFSSDLGV